MADILIRGMEMPTQCGNCPISTNTRRCTILWREFGDPSERLEDCPLVPLPKGHGRLGDLDKIVSFIDYYEGPMDRNTSPFKALNVVRDYICNASNTIVPAEGGSEADKKTNCSDCGNRNTPVCKYCEHDAEGGGEDG